MPPPEIEPGTIAVDWEKRAVFKRSFQANYWYDSRYPNVGMILNQDEWIVRSCEIIRFKR